MTTVGTSGRSVEATTQRGLPDVGQITFDDASADRLNDYSINRKNTYDDARRRLRKHPSPFFGTRRMITITTTELRGKLPHGSSSGSGTWQCKNICPRPCNPS